MFAKEIVLEHGGNFAYSVWNVFQAIDEIMSVFALLTIVLSDCLEAGEADNVGVLDGLCR